MITRTIEFDYGSYLVEVEATQDGRVLEATISVDHMDPTDCTEQFRKSDFCMKELYRRIEEIDWNDHGDGEDISLKDRVAEIIGVRPA